MIVKEYIMIVSFLNILLLEGYFFNITENNTTIMQANVIGH